MGVALLLDSRRDLRDDDRDLLHWLAEQETPVIPVITKVDKFAKNKAKQRLAAWARSLKGLTSVPPVGFSTTAGLGKEETLSAFAKCLAGELKPASPEQFEQIAG
jgi:GTP-binding protein EngB required for normal cell division